MSLIFPDQLFAKVTRGQGEGLRTSSLPHYSSQLPLFLSVTTDYSLLKWCLHSTKFPLPLRFRRASTNAILQFLHQPLPQWWHILPSNEVAPLFLGAFCLVLSIVWHLCANLPAPQAFLISPQSHILFHLIQGEQHPGLSRTEENPRAWDIQC